MLFWLGAGCTFSAYRLIYLLKILRVDSARRAREHHKCNWLIVLFLIEDVIQPELEKGQGSVGRCFCGN